MRFRSKVEEVEVSGASDTGVFRVASNAKTFEMFSKGIYERPTEAVLRELSANAYDAHIAAGKRDVPIYVRLPTRLDSRLIVRDEGIGMSHDFVMEEYNTFGVSTKDESDDEIGGFGLGSKTPLAISNTFTLIVRYEGKERVYTSVRSKSGIPVTNLMSTTDTDKCNGVEVIVPCSENDARRIRDCANKIFEYYEPRPNVNWDAAGDEKRTMELDTDMFRLFGITKSRYGYTENTKIRLVMGVVAYPIDIDQLDGLDNATRQKARQLNFDIKLPIGSVEMANSRETLLYDDETEKLVTQTVKDSVDEIMQHYVGSIADINDYYDACCAYNDARNSLPFLDYSMVIDGRRVNSQVHIKRHTEAVRGIEYITGTTSDFYERMPKKNLDGSFSVTYDRKTLFMIDDVYHCFSRAKRVLTAMEKRGKTKIVLIRSNRLHKTNRDEIYNMLEREFISIFNQMGVPDEDQFCILSETPEIPREVGYSGWRTSVGGIRKAKQAFLDGEYGGDVYDNHTVITASDDVEEDEELPGEAIFVVMSRGKPEITSSKLFHIISVEKLPVYFIPKSLVRKVPSEWTNIKDKLDTITQRVRVASYIKQAWKHNAYEHDIYSSVRSTINTIRKNGFGDRLDKFFVENPKDSFTRLVNEAHATHDHTVDSFKEAVITYAHRDLRDKIEYRLEKALMKRSSDFHNDHKLLASVLNIGSRRPVINYEILDYLLKDVYKV